MTSREFLSRHLTWCVLNSEMLFQFFFTFAKFIHHHPWILMFSYRIKCDCDLFTLCLFQRHTHSHTQTYMHTHTHKMLTFIITRKPHTLSHKQTHSLTHTRKPHTLSHTQTRSQTHTQTNTHFVAKCSTKYQGKQNSRVASWNNMFYDAIEEHKLWNYTRELTLRNFGKFVI
jgi:hypothetical protein